MKEDFIHYVWKVKNFSWQELYTVNGEPLQIIDFGTHNHNAGPDFLNGKIKIGEKIWSGNIEMHLKSSDWYQHRHDSDPNYENVILHVVWDYDKPVNYQDGTQIPCIELKNSVDPNLVNRYEQLHQNLDWIPCEKQIGQVSKIKIPFWLKNLTVERLEQKTVYLKAQLERLNGHWEQLFFQELASNFGLKVNVEAFRALAESIQVEHIYKHNDQLDQLEALLFGQSGLITSDNEEAYAKKLLKEYKFLAHKYKLKPIPKLYWQFARLRPANFPTVRIAQFAQVLHHSKVSFSKIIEKSETEIMQVFEGIQASPYWDTHYRFDKISDPKPKKLGKSRIQVLLINSVVPMLFFYGKQKKDEQYLEKALDLLDLLVVEKNKVLTQWKSLGVVAKTAFDSQALLQLKKYYCDQKRCLNCSIGHSILSLK